MFRDLILITRPRRNTRPRVIKKTLLISLLHDSFAWNIHGAQSAIAKGSTVKSNANFSELRLDFISLPYFVFVLFFERVWGFFAFLLSVRFFSEKGYQKISVDFLDTGRHRKTAVNLFLYQSKRFVTKKSAFHRRLSAHSLPR